MAKRKQEHCQVMLTAKGVRIILPKTDDLSPLYSRKQMRSIIADLQSALDDDMFYS
jgi:hypothetical protein